MRVIAYLRVSTDDQSLGLEAERAAIEAWARFEGHDVAGWHVDNGVSGLLPIEARTGLVQALSALQAGDLLVAAKRDRIARNVMVAAMAEQLARRVGARIVTADGVSADDTPEGQLMRTMMDAFAAYEGALIRARTSAALQAKRGRGERVGAVPYGSRVADAGVHLIADESEQQIAMRVRGLAAVGVSHRAIAATLNAEHVPARGARWHATTVGRLLRRGT